ncbi:endothelin-converting enzyme 1 [Plakobranchus ocellatus]|uniref:Endothelin-converting enzyme 1 n=1 Tax=Plakobranchus ocellatus TaxID=259542 RepID=A0AAV3Y786_9GAST|nr:endothelin-converting enzyme 1 [Plakobranchus ocellatus]
MWTRHAENGFKEATVCMANQYSDFVINDHHLNGNTTLGENIADNGGFKLSYRAFQAAGKPSTARLPGLNYTDNQLFFLGFSQLWCSIETPEHILLAINTDPHSTPIFRVRGVLSNSQEFSDSFNCKAGSPMNPEDKCKVW